MEFIAAQEHHWPSIQSIYLEAFPRRERKPYFILRQAVRKEKAQVMVACEGSQLLGFVVLIPYQSMVMVDYLAVSSKIRSKGTGSYIMKQVCQTFAHRRIILLIERLDDLADNRQQRIARRAFYLNNGFESSHIFLTGASGEMEVMIHGGTVSPPEFLALQKYALGPLFFHLSGCKILSQPEEAPSGP